ncbi:MAG: hypothetical protein KBC07_01670 [Bacteroidales bacterium]|jgi:hypothetical protein|nr:hypothetical protein [Bacteroidales bacterium]NLH24166.1 hypothetical protein [Bacteroidales bacterium]
MKKSLILAIFAVFVLLSACQPVEIRQELKGGITESELNISAVPQIRDGKNSNYIDLNSDGNACLSSWDFGVGLFVGTKGTVKVMMKGPNDIIFTGLNADGTKITKTLTVQVDALYDVEPEWALFCGATGEKTWEWDNVTGPGVWGNGGFKGCAAPCWWVVSLGDINGQAPGEGAGASMTFTIAGARLIKNFNDGTTVQGSFTFDMSKIILDDGGNVWAKGKLNTKNVTVLCGKSPNEGGAPVNSYDILKLTENNMVLSYPEPGVGSWGTAWFWMFKKK